jgi:hypothetical protein
METKTENPITTELAKQNVTEAVIPEPTTPTFNAVRGSHEPTMSPPKITEISDEEKLFRYASALESVSTPDVKTSEGIEVLKNANKLINEAINLLRK